MRLLNHYLIYFVLLFVFSTPIQSQTDSIKSINDSLKTKEFQYLLDKYIKHKNDSYAANIYSKASLSKAIFLKDTLKIISSLAIRGSFFYKNRDFTKALDLFIKCYDLSKTKKGELFQSRMVHNIGAIRIRSGEYEKALKIFKVSYSYFENNPELIDKKNSGYYKILFSLANAYRRLEVKDSALYYTELGLNRLTKKSNHYYHLLLTKSIVNLENKKVGLKYLKKDFDTVIDYYSKNDKKINPNLAFAYYYSGKLDWSKNNYEQAIKKFKKIDSIYDVYGDIHPELRPTYEYILKYYQQRKNVQNELKYVKKLLIVDSMLNENYRHLDTKIYKEYDTPILLAEKQNIIKKLEAKNDESYYLLGGSLFIILIIGVLLTINYSKKKQYKIRFEELIENKKLENVERKPLEESSIGISEDIVGKILNELDKFEKSNDFTKLNITSTMLAKKLKTNSKYLTKIIKHHKNKNFSPYLNDLRIEYIIERLKKDKKLQEYTIKAIAKEAGFNSAEVFSKYFFKKTGIYPSYFIKKLINRNL